MVNIFVIRAPPPQKKTKQQQQTNKKTKTNNSNNKQTLSAIGWGSSKAMLYNKVVFLWMGGPFYHTYISKLTKGYIFYISISVNSNIH